MKLEDLYETPMIIEPLDWFELNDPELNIQEYNKRISREYTYKNKILELTPNASIYQHKREFFCLDSHLNKITYYMTYEVSRNRRLKDYVWQSLVWRYQPLANNYLKEIPQKIFWEFLFPKFGTVITDSEQTWNGRSFWEARIAEALQKNINIYFYDFRDNELQQLTHYDELRLFQSKYNIWGHESHHTMKRMLITNNQLI